MAKTISAEMTTMIGSEVMTLATCWHVTRTDGVERFVTDHDADVVFGGDTYEAASGLARTAIESKGDMSVDNLDIVGILGGDITSADLRAGFYDFAEIEVFSVNWQDPDGFGKIQHRFGSLGEVQVRDGAYKAEMRGKMQALERRRGKVYSPDCRANLFSPLTDPISGRVTGCGLASAAFEEFGEVVTDISDREFVVNEFSTLKVTPTYQGEFGDVTQVREDADGIVTGILGTAALQGSPMRPITIANRAQLEAISDDLFAHYVLTADIDLTSTAWTPLGDETRPFMGTFDGRGFVIRNLTVDTSGTDPAGLFGACGGMIRRVGVEGFDVRSSSATEWAGALCGILLGDVASDYPLAGGGHIETCWAIGGTVTTDGNFAGGLVGWVYPGTVMRETWTAAAISGAIGDDVGAIVGRANSAEADRVSVANFGNVDAAGISDLGNIVGGGYTPRADAAWGNVINWPSPFDFNDREVMNVVASTAVTAAFVDSNPDTITRAAGSWIDDGVRPEDEIAFTGTASNNFTYRVRSMTATVLTLESGDDVVVESAVACNFTCAGGPRTMDPGRF
ncbi:hypothetical protein LCGC14_1340050 [marine sediment metagenome]|uniref:Uncharacterized protein n=1 Tax=marine sediment metagenome TaxID=412755 RepID=A0A0F9MUW9_9ZZZZ